MGGKFQVPNNIEDKTVLKRFLTDLVMGINGSTLFSGNIQEQNEALVEILQSNPNIDFINIVSKLTELRTDILTYVEDNIETIVLQQQEDLAVIAEQFGTFYEQALAASWYGLIVKAGGAVAGLEVGSLDPDVITPGDESSYFRVVADNFILGRAYEDLTQAEKDYLTANNLPNFGTVYNASKQPVPALVTTWDSVSQIYRHYFNGIVQFSNIAGADYANAINLGTTTINGGKITTSTLEANVLKPANGGSTVWSGGALVSQNFNGNTVGNIGNPTTGFRLSSNATGTFDDPNIFGAYIRGSTIEGLTLTINDVKVKSPIYSNNFGPLYLQSFDSSTIFTTLTSITFMPANSGSGFLDTRMCTNNTQAFMLRAGLSNATTFASIRITLQVSINSGTWTNIGIVTTGTSSIVNNYLYTHTTSNTASVAFRAICSRVSGDTATVFCYLDVYSVNGQ